MAFRDELRVNLSVTWKKAAGAKVNFLFFSGFLILLGYLWHVDSLLLSFKFFTFLFPYFFLLLSQDMVKDELESGCLENVLFLRGKFRRYLLHKNLYLFAVASLCVAPVFFAFFITGLFTKESSALHVYPFLVGLLVGFFYISLGGLLSYYFKGGANVLIVILGQASVFMGLLFSARFSAGFIDCLDKGVFPDSFSKLKFLAVVLVFPNIVISKKFLAYSILVAGLSALALTLQAIKAGKTELSRK